MVNQQRQYWISGPSPEYLESYENSWGSGARKKLSPNIDWKIIYTDMYGDSIHEEMAYNCTYNMAMEQGLAKWPVDRAIEDFHVKPLN